MFKTKFVNFASFIPPFGQTHDKNRETLCSQVCAFVFLQMLGPKQPYHKKHGPEKAGWHLAKDQSWGELFRSSVRVSYSRTDLCDPRLFTTISHNYAKIQNSFG